MSDDFTEAVRKCYRETFTDIRQWFVDKGYLDPEYLKEPLPPSLRPPCPPGPTQSPPRS